MKRTLDIFVSVLVLVAAGPFLLIGIMGVKLSSPGPAFYRAQRIGLGGAPYEMFKLRSMHIASDGPVITSQNDTRIFGFGRFIRASKIDELPQLLNVILGDMSVVGPRPEDAAIVRDAYTDWMMKTLAVRPGMTSPGAIFYYLHGEQLIDEQEPERSYIENLLPIKLAIECNYLDRATVLTDFVVIGRTIWAIATVAFGFPGPRVADEVTRGRAFLAEREKGVR